MITGDIRMQFPVFSAHPDLIYLDNAATTQRPEAVIRAMDDFYRSGNANIHRGVYDLSARATEEYEQTRALAAKFLGAGDASNIGFTRGTTESVNIIARAFLQPKLTGSDNVVVTIAEHHANFIPWQQVCEETGTELRIVPVDDSGRLDMDVMSSMIDERTKMVAVAHISNTRGTIHPIDQVIAMAHAKGAPVMIDAAQSAALYDLDVSRRQNDFLAFSAHKMFGPFGTGILYAADQYKGDIGPYTVGGGMIRHVSVEGTSFQRFPYNLEAGTPNISGVIGLKAAIEYVMGLDRGALRKELDELTAVVRQGLAQLEGVQLLGPDEGSSSIISFNVEGVHPHDAATFLNAEGIAVRAGMHCTQPLLASMELPGTVRASFSIYNTMEEGRKLVQAVEKLYNFWK